MLHALVASVTSVRAELAEAADGGGPHSVREAEAALLRVERAIDATYELLRQADPSPANGRPAGRAPVAIVTDGVRHAELLPTDAANGREAAGSLASLTRREREVLSLLMDGRTNRQIASALFITEKTAGGHVSSILGKLGVSSRLQAASIAMRGTGEVGQSPLASWLGGGPAL